MNIALTGFMASGKTEISKQLSKLLSYNWVDTDEMITEKMNMSVNDIFSKYGEEVFRKTEHEIISQCTKLDNTVISTGGGVPMNKDNMTELRKNSVIVYLAPDFDTIKERLFAARASRPLLKNESIENIEKRFNERLPYYADCDLKIKVSNDFEAKHFAEEILIRLNSFITE